MTPETYKAMSERERMEFALSHGIAAVAGRQISFEDNIEKALPKDTRNIDIGIVIRARRWMAGMTQHQLGKKTGISAVQIQRYETGQTALPSRHLVRIARGLDVPLAAFLDFAGAISGASEKGEAQRIERFSSVQTQKQAG